MSCTLAQTFETPGTRQTGIVDLPADTVALAGEYVRCRYGGITPTCAADLAWERFYRWCDATIRRFAASLRVKGVELDDCAQEVWSDLLRGLRNFRLDESRGRFSSWLYTIVRSKAMNLARRRGRFPAAELPASVTQGISAHEGDPAVICQRTSDREMVHRLLAELRRRVSERSYRVLHLRHVEGCDPAQVAMALGLSVAQVWARDHRMKRELRQLCRTARMN